MSARTYATDALTRHQVFLQRYAGGQVKKTTPFLIRMLKDINLRLKKAGTTEFQTKRLLTLEKDLVHIINTNITDMGKSLTSELKELGIYEGEFTEKLLGNIVDVNVSGTSASRIIHSVTDSKMKLLNGKKYADLTITQAVKKFSKSTSTNVIHSIQSGLVEGRTTQEITRDINRLVKHRTKAQAEALVRTSTNHAASSARNEVFKNNDDIIDKEEFLGTLDNRTTDTCAGFDGQYFEVGQGAMPPLHYNCRSVRIPIVKQEYALADLEGTRSARGASGKSTKIGGGVAFDGWLRKQPATFQKEYFAKFKDGDVKYSLFKKGKLSIPKFIDSKGAAYSLRQLKNREPHAFELMNAKPKRVRTTKPNLDAVVKKTVAPPFVKAKTIGEVEERIREMGVEKVKLNGLGIERANATLRAAELEHAISPLDLRAMVISNSPNGGWGAKYAPHSKTITLNRAHIGKGHSAKSPLPYKKQIDELDEMISKYETDYLGNSQYSQWKVKQSIRDMGIEKNKLGLQIAEGETPRYWSMSARAKTKFDSTLTTVTHEIGHHRQRMLNYPDTGFSEISAISEYGRENFHEYFAEWYAAYRTGVVELDDVPETMRYLIKLVGN